MRLLRVLVLCCLSVCAAVAVNGSVRHRPSARDVAGISQLVESRAGKTSCWGVMIHLRKLRFKPNVGRDEIEIQEAKHGNDFRDSMTWRVDEGGRRLVIKFKPGLGDFGSGDNITIRVHGSAFTGRAIPIPPDGWLGWMISTDVM